MALPSSATRCAPRHRRRRSIRCGSLMRPADRAEMEALEGSFDFLDVLRGWMTAPMNNPMAQPSSEARRTLAPRLLTIADRPAVLHGIVASAGWAGHATPWLAAISTMAHDELTAVMWLSRLQADTRSGAGRCCKRCATCATISTATGSNGWAFVPQGRVEYVRRGRPAARSSYRRACAPRYRRETPWVKQARRNPCPIHAARCRARPTSRRKVSHASRPADRTNPAHPQ